MEDRRKCKALITFPPQIQLNRFGTMGTPSSPLLVQGLELLDHKPRTNLASRVEERPKKIISARASLGQGFDRIETGPVLDRLKNGTAGNNESYDTYDLQGT
ncbi:Hypothetical protein NTJ_01876 [Nesidiocoris tenuis]|uniref:Uncharacterized protein n=1 Tax=Nesidiocoris tenuis TaxID=355587 RepID=A0ABN7AD30_9HEMI|nr:Hypothetical protein NTJ_01876 [Nesidiocoris tenuis]